MKLTLRLKSTGCRDLSEIEAWRRNDRHNSRHKTSTRDVRTSLTQHSSNLVSKYITHVMCHLVKFNFLWHLIHHIFHNNFRCKCFCFSVSITEISSRLFLFKGLKVSYFTSRLVQYYINTVCHDSDILLFSYPLEF